MNDRARETMRLQTIARYWVRAGLLDFELARKCAWDEAEREGLRFDRKEMNAALRRAFNCLTDAERDEMYPTIVRPDMQPRYEDPHGLPSPIAISCHQDQDQDQVKDQDEDERGGLRETSAGAAAARSGSVPARSIDEQPETYDLLERHERGLLNPLPVTLGALPESAGYSMRAVADDIALLIGLRLAVDEDRPLLYSTSFCAWRMGWTDASGAPDKRRASRVINKLLDAGVVECVGTMPRTGTRLFSAPSASAVARPAPERPAVGVDADIQPSLEVTEQAVVHQAQPILGKDLGIVTTRNGAVTRNDRA